jgi:hypothetical protein
MPTVMVHPPRTGWCSRNNAAGSYPTQTNAALQNPLATTGFTEGREPTLFQISRINIVSS